MRNADAIECLELIMPLCESVSGRIERYAMTAESVRQNADHLDLLLMPIFQIGEIVGSGNRHEALQELYPSDVWTQEYGLRNHIAHAYGKLDGGIIWQTATESIPALQKLCKELLERC